ncbi:hypothetical protein D2T29_07645 [Sinirhodobacter populi]|uniref:Uncharacterized protein n=1 Tax=Paenirhodobacter populi TaxID=2306993 RepID=A0A443KJJ9_9RHOB|nr:hypothetical protein D2T29_07645 [Sinirhodobacter populi]
MPRTIRFPSSFFPKYPGGERVCARGLAPFPAFRPRSVISGIPGPNVAKGGAAPSAFGLTPGIFREKRRQKDRHNLRSAPLTRDFLAGIRAPAYIARMIVVFDITERVRLSERFTGESRSALARL